VGMAFSLTPDDHYLRSHRSHGEILAKAFSAIRCLSDEELLTIMRSYREVPCSLQWKKATRAPLPAWPYVFSFTVRTLSSSHARPGSTGALAAPCTRSSLRSASTQQRDRRRVRIDRPGAALYKRANREAGYRGREHRRCLVCLRPRVGGHHLREHGPVQDALGPGSGRRAPHHLQLHGQLLRDGRPTNGETMSCQLIARIGRGQSRQMHAERVNGYDPLRLSMPSAARRRSWPRGAARGCWTPSPTATAGIRRRTPRATALPRKSNNGRQLTRSRPIASGLFDAGVVEGEAMDEAQADVQEIVFAMFCLAADLEASPVYGELGIGEQRHVLERPR